ncbi:hypothetical protein LCGC14_1325190 [marine sediment metagenome]|uniref:Enoyl-CoA hydratase n=1 Tax=marine sediment metagenome TaxID=412755 RepID=A0A0F9MZ80_9ZZZZ
MDFKFIIVEKKDHLAIIRLNQPKVLNLFEKESK